MTRVVIVGGGLAGLAAAETLSRTFKGDDRERPEIVVLEAKRTAGGRAGSYYDGASGQEVDYCQHAAMGCCTNFLDLMRRLELDGCFRRWSRLHFLHPDTPNSEFAPSTWLPPPLHLLPCLAGLRFLSRSQQREIRRGLWKLMRTPADSLRDVLAVDWLHQARQSAETVSAFWDVILISALGEKTEHVSMAAARKVLIDGFAAARGASDVLVPRLPLSELLGRRSVEQLTKRGVKVMTGVTVRGIETQCVNTGDGSYSADAVISAVPWYRLGSLFENWPPQDRGLLSDVKRLSQIPTSSISGLHLWFDRAITDLEHAVMVGTTAQWLFRDPCDDPASREEDAGNSVVDRETHYYQVVISASAEVISRGKEAVLNKVLGELRAAFPPAATASLRRWRLVTDPKSVFSVNPQVESLRPPQTTDFEWLFLAGDWTQTGWPATMEGAVISGRMAAKGVLEFLRGSGFLPANAALKEPLVDRGLRKGFLARCLIRQ
ncbi:MAG: hydroxysqualene dehydroxylase HpnE [Planctomycetota bacterium]